MIIDNTLNRTNDNYTQSLPVTISFIRTNTWNIRLFQRPVGNTTSKSVPKTSLEIASFCSDFNERPCLLESEFETSNLSIRASHLSLCPERAKCQNDVQMTHLTYDWQLELNRTNQELRSWANRVLKNNNDFGRNSSLANPTPLYIFDQRPPPWYSLQLPLKSKMVAIIFIKEILSSRSPKLRLLCRLTIARYWLLFFNHKWYIPFRKHQVKVIFLGMNSDSHIS